MVVHAHYPLGEPRVQREARAARDAGYEVCVLALRGEGERASELVDGVMVHRAPLRHRRGGGLIVILFEYLAFCLYAAWWLAWRCLREPFDIVHVHNPPDVLVFSALGPKLRGASLLLDVHDLSSHIFGARFGGVIGRAATAALVWNERLAARFVDRVVTVHEPYRRELVHHGISASRIEIVMNAVDDAVLERTACEPSPLVAPAADFRLAYHGTLTHWYGVDLIVDALARLRAGGVDAAAVIVGDGDALPSLRARVEELGLSEHVLLSGCYLPIEQALAVVRTADCGVIPNRPSEINRFALSSKLFEYVALGIPVVVSELETLAAHFSSDEVTFFAPGYAASLTAALTWVKDHPAEARERAERAAVRAQQYAWPQSRAALLGAYDALQLRGGGR
jgi:glycosyltransferase involved in cell wall biosynthesis